MQGKKAAGHHFQKRCCRNATLVPSRCKAMQARNHACYLLKGAVAANGAWQVTSILWLRAKEPPSIRVRSRRLRIGIVAPRRGRPAGECPKPKPPRPPRWLGAPACERTPTRP